jgi:hypothetical protein
MCFLNYGFEWFKCKLCHRTCIYNTDILVYQIKMWNKIILTSFIIDACKSNYEFQDLETRDMREQKYVLYSDFFNFTQFQGGLRCRRWPQPEDQNQWLKRSRIKRIRQGKKTHHRVLLPSFISASAWRMRRYHWEISSSKTFLLSLPFPSSSATLEHNFWNSGNKCHI